MMIPLTSRILESLNLTIDSKQLGNMRSEGNWSIATGFIIWFPWFKYGQNNASMNSGGITSVPHMSFYILNRASLTHNGAFFIIL